MVLFFGAQLFCFFSGILATGILHQAAVPGFRHTEDFGNILVATLSFQGATWLLIPIYLHLNEINWRDFFGLRTANALRAVGWAIAALIVLLPVAAGLERLSELGLQRLGWESQPEEAVRLLLNAPLWPTGIYLGVFAIVLAPVAEEFIFRGVLFPFVKQLGWPKMAWVGVSFLFALIHASPGIFVPLFVLALGLTWLYEKTGNLLASIVAHSLFNAANLVLLVLADELSRRLPVQS
ncbi:MAG TPA: type II CAAX endopeptidase family protein [Verrucomicrobiae bacterium]|nr:type II CAAX endopeptidase family protein [Verrucomicrobiae bacterium]